jgi:hypothetical protein
MAAIVFKTRYDYRHASGDLPYGPGTLLKLVDGATVHIVDANYQLRTFTTGSQFESMGFQWGDIISVDRDVLNAYGLEMSNPGESVGNGSWGTPITESNPLVLQTAAGEPATDIVNNETAGSSDGISNSGQAAIVSPSKSASTGLSNKIKYGGIAVLTLLGLYFLFRKQK